ncbi:MAG: hypothetical protein P1U32_03750 [Legionellaceae bacterium]|nr:hypothetical protein [Legionellaceae bacterium]
MGHRFFGTTSPVTVAEKPTTIMFTNRADMALTVLATDWQKTGNTAKKEALENASFPHPPINLSSPQAMTNWLSSQANVFKEKFLELPVDGRLFPSSTWFIEALSESCHLNINVARRVGNSLVPSKTNPSEKHDIMVHEHPFQTTYTVRVKMGPLFEYLNQRYSHQTDPRLDKLCEDLFQRQRARALEEAPLVLRKLETMRAQLLSELSKEEIDSLYRKNLGSPIPHGFPSLPYNTLTEGQATQLALQSMYQNLQQEQDISSTLSYGA